MTYIITSKRRAAANKRPQWPYTLDKDSPHAQGLVAWYPFPPFRDAISMGPVFKQRLTNNGDIAWVSDPEMGLVPEWPSTGTTYYFQLDSAVLTTMPIAIAAWVRCDAAAQNNDFNIAQISEKASPSKLFRFGVSGISNTRMQAEHKSGTSAAARTTVDWSLNKWEHLSGSFDNSASRTVWLNAGAKDINTTSIGAIAADRTSIGLEGDSSPSDSWEGQMADVRFYNKAFTDDFVSFLYSPGKRWDLYYQSTKRYFIPAAAAGAPFLPYHNKRDNVLLRM